MFEGKRKLYDYSKLKRWIYDKEKSEPLFPSKLKNIVYDFPCRFCNIVRTKDELTTIRQSIKLKKEIINVGAIL